MYAPGFGPPVGGGMGPGFQNFRELSRLAKFPTFRNSEFGMHEQRDLVELWIHYLSREFSVDISILVDNLAKFFVLL